MKKQGWETRALHSTDTGKVAEEGYQICGKGNCVIVAVLFFSLTVQIAIEYSRKTFHHSKMRQVDNPEGLTLLLAIL